MTKKTSFYLRVGRRFVLFIPSFFGIGAFFVSSLLGAAPLPSFGGAILVSLFLYFAVESFRRAYPLEAAKKTMAMASGDLPLSPLPLPAVVEPEIRELVLSFNELVRSRIAMEERVEFEWSLVQDALNSLSEAVCVLDENGIIISANRGWTRARENWPESPLFSLGLGESYYRAGLDEINDSIRRILSGEVDDCVIEEVDSSCGGVDAHFIVKVRKAFGSGVNGISYRCVVSHLDDTERRRVAERLSLMAAVFSNAGEAVVITDATNRIQAVNASFERITGYSLEEVEGQDPKMLSAGGTSASVYKNMWASLIARDAWEGEMRDRRKDGTVYPKWLSIRVLRDCDGRVSNHIGIFSDISERKAAEARIVHQANHDALTGLPNRLMLNALLERALSDARRDGKKVCLMLLDLDRFKNVNDSLGHHVGDALLLETSRRLAACVRGGDFVARLGGDEFVIVLRETSQGGILDSAKLVAERVVASLSEPFKLDDSIVRTAASIGATFFPEDAQDISGLLKCADLAMYHAKSSGRGVWRRYHESLNRALIERQALENDLRDALSNKGGGVIEPYFQPKIKLDTLSVCGFEALARWRLLDGSFISPERFVPVAEDCGLVSTLGEVMLRKSLDAVLRWTLAGDFDPTEMSVAVNLSPSQFLDKELPFRILSELERRCLPSCCLELEITEGLAMDDPDATAAALRELKEAGLKVSVDDFGTGYSSLSRLNHLPFSTLKIDRSFVSDVDKKGETFTRGICEITIILAHRLNMDVVAEGVETLSQMRTLEEMGCEKIQGFIFAKPMPEEQILPFLRDFDGESILKKLEQAAGE